MNEEAVASLQELGLSQYEARAYLGLLTGGQLNGNELSRAIGVPSSKIYSTLDKLVAAGIVRHVRRESGAAYVAAEPAELVSRLRERFARPLETLERLLPTLAIAAPEPDVLQLTNADVIAERARAMIRGAQERVLLSARDEELDELRDELRDADARGVAVAASTYEDADAVAGRIGGRMLTLVVDGSQALLAQLDDRGGASGVQTRQAVLCLVAEESVRHAFAPSGSTTRPA